MSWLLRTRLTLAVTVLLWVAAAAVPALVPYPTIRAGVQWIDLGALIVILPLVVSIWHRWQSEPERMVGPVRVAPALLDTALVAVLPVGAGVLALLGSTSAAHALVPSLALGALALVVGSRGVPPAATGLAVVWLAVSMLLGDRADGSAHAWALPIATEAGGPTVGILTIVFACACVFAAATDAGGRRAERS